MDPDRRRCGVGRALVVAASYHLRADTRLRGFVWDDASAAFWSRIELPAVETPDVR